MPQCVRGVNVDPNWSCCALYRVTRFIHVTLDWDELVEEVLDLAVEVTRSRRAVLLLANGSVETLEPAGVRDADTEDVSKALELGRRTLAAGRMVPGSAPVLESELGEWSGGVAEAGCEGSCLCLPLWDHDRPLGVLCLNDPDHAQRFPRSWFPFYAALADQIATAFVNARRYSQLQHENALLRERADGEGRFAAILGDSAPMRRMKRMLARVVGSSSTVLIEGESGTGKELVAQALHYEGPRHEAAFVAENCAALPDALLESELFGHVRGAFTGAEADKPGLFEVADGGTLFLDEIADTSPAMQAKLLRVLDGHEIRRVGDTRSRRIDVRVLAATSRDLTAAVSAGSFRPELYYRLSVLTLHVPPLRERRADIPMLAEHFLSACAARAGKALSGFSPEAMGILRGYPWPGNVRQLRNEVERMAALADPGQPVGYTLLSDELRQAKAALPSAAGITGAMPEALERFKRGMIEQALDRATGNRTRAAEILGISRPNLQKMMRRLGIH